MERTRPRRGEEGETGVGQEPLIEPTLSPHVFTDSRRLQVAGRADRGAAPHPSAADAANLDA